jgi:D-aminoacyl-tRNA deacylase
MRAVVQRVSSASVVVDQQLTGEIKGGLLVYLGIEKNDTAEDVGYMVEKITNLRIFEDEDGKMNRSMIDEAGEMLCISQFTLLGDCRRGRRPSFTDAKEPAAADELYKQFIQGCRSKNIKTETGIFQAHMEVSSVNDGPVTMMIDSKKMF